MARPQDHKFSLLLVFIIIFAGYCLAFGFNTVDQMIIRYKYYFPYWNRLEYWEMCWFWKPNWWNVYILSLVAIWFSGFLYGIAGMTIIALEKRIGRSQEVKTT